MTKYNPLGWAKGDAIYTQADIDSLPPGSTYTVLGNDPWTALIEYVPPAPDPAPSTPTHMFALVEPVETYASGRVAYPHRIMTDRGFVRFHDRAYKPNEALAFAATITSAALALIEGKR